MAEPTTIPAGYLNILLGDSGTPETFQFICGITSNGITVTTNGTDVFVPDCDDPAKLAIRRHVSISEQADMTASGLYSPDTIAQIEGLRGVAKHYRFQAALPDELVTAGYTPSYWDGNFKLTTYTATGERGTGGLATLTGLNFVSDGDFTFVAGNTP